MCKFFCADRDFGQSKQAGLHRLNLTFPVFTLLYN